MFKVKILMWSITSILLLTGPPVMGDATEPDSTDVDDQVEVQVEVPTNPRRHFTLDINPREDYISFVMSKKLHQDIGLSGPFNTLEEEVFIGLVRTHWELASEVNAVYARGNLTASQYNALRILRGANPEPFTCSEISRRMVTRDSDLTRILVGLERRSLVERQKSNRDRRIIDNCITQEGLDLLASLDEPVVEAICRLFQHLSQSKLKQLSALFEDVRNR